jgi:hypothetical protein
MPSKTELMAKLDEMKKAVDSYKDVLSNTKQAPKGDKSPGKQKITI